MGGSSTSGSIRISAIAKLIVRDANGQERVLFDPAANVGGAVSINNYSVSADGKLIAFHIAQGGGEVGTMHFMNVDTGVELPDQLTPIWGEESVSWIDNQTVLYTRMDPASADPLQNMDTRLHRMGTPATADVVLISPGHGVNAREFPFAYDSPLSDWTVGTGGGARADYRLFVARDADVRAGNPNWVSVADYADNINSGDVRGDYAYLLTTHRKPNGEIVRVDLRHPDIAHATVLYAPDDLVLTGVAATRDGLYVDAQRIGVSHLIFFRNATGAPHEIALPFAGSLGNFASNGDATAVTFEMSGWLQNVRYFSARAGDLAPLGVEAPTYPGVANYQVINEEAVSADGTRVPLFILRRAISRAITMRRLSSMVMRATASRKRQATRRASMLGWSKAGCMRFAPRAAAANAGAAGMKAAASATNPTRMPISTPARIA